MKIILPIVVLAIAVLGCGRFGAGSNAGNTTGQKANSAPAAAAKAVDMPSLVGKSPDEIKKIVGIEPRFETPYLAFELPQGTLTVDYMKGKQTTIGFEPTTGSDSAEKLGDMVGIDVHGKPESRGSGEFHFYDDLNANGKTLRQVSFRKVGDKFTNVSIDVEPLF